MSAERWAKIEGFPQYSVSDQGNVRNDRSEMPRNSSVTRQGAVKITLYRDGVPYTKSLAPIVAAAHVWNDWDPTIFGTPIHLNNMITDNRAVNLAWRPRWFAKKYQMQYYETHYRFARTKVIDTDTGILYHNLVTPCQEFGLLYVDVLNSCTNGAGVFPLGKGFIFGPNE